MVFLQRYNNSINAEHELGLNVNKELRYKRPLTIKPEPCMDLAILLTGFHGN